MSGVPEVPSAGDVWPGRKYDWSGVPMTSKLRSALRRSPGRAVLCVSACVNGRRVRWSTTTLDLPCAAVHGGSLRFEGALTGDGEYKSSLSLGDRVADLGTFGVSADNSELLGIERSGTPGAYVVPLAGGTVEIALAHRDVDWADRAVQMYGYLTSAKYGPDGEDLQFTATPRWGAVRGTAMPVLDVTGFPYADPAQFGKPYPLMAGLLSRHRILKVRPDVDDATVAALVLAAETAEMLAAAALDAGDVLYPFLYAAAVSARQAATEAAANSWYLISGLPVGASATAVWDGDDASVPIVSNVVGERDGYGNKVEVLCVESNEPELYASCTSKYNNFFTFIGDNPGSVGDLILFLLARIGNARGEDVDLSGAAVYARLFLHAYGLSVDSGTTTKDLLEGRVVKEAYGFMSVRAGRYGFTPVPFGDGFPGSPAGAMHLRWGRELLAGGVSSETDDSELTNGYTVNWRDNPSSGEYENYLARAATDITPDKSFWLRVSEGLFGPAGEETVELPDLWRWYDVRSVLRLDERFRALILRETEYDALPEAAACRSGDVVFITDERNGWEVKPFLVTAVGVTTRPLVKLYLLEWPGTADLFGVHGSGAGPGTSAKPLGSAPG